MIHIISARRPGLHELSPLQMITRRVSNVNAVGHVLPPLRIQGCCGEMAETGLAGLRKLNRETKSEISPREPGNSNRNRKIFGPEASRVMIDERSASCSSKLANP